MNTEKQNNESVISTKNTTGLADENMNTFSPEVQQAKYNLASILLLVYTNGL